ncbi:TetR/AcrR family transcriptional regulator [Patulibacter sp. S7RM1-6]
MPDRPARTPTRRADAARNRERILAAAREAFASPDADVSMAEVSRRAGVGMATLYRNFGSRRELLEALYADEVDAVCRAAEGLDGPPRDALVAWLRRFVDYFASKRPVASELLTQTDGDDPVFAGNRDRVLGAGRPLLLAAQDAGEVRDDLALEQVLDMVVAVARVSSDAAYVEPMLRAVFDGLRPPADAA